MAKNTQPEPADESTEVDPTEHVGPDVEHGVPGPEATENVTVTDTGTATAPDNDVVEENQETPPADSVIQSPEISAEPAKSPEIDEDSIETIPQEITYNNPSAGEGLKDNTFHALGDPNPDNPVVTPNEPNQHKSEADYPDGSQPPADNPTQSHDPTAPGYVAPEAAE